LVGAVNQHNDSNQMLNCWLTISHGYTHTINIYNSYSSHVLHKTWRHIQTNVVYWLELLPLVIYSIQHTFILILAKSILVSFKMKRFLKMFMFSIIVLYQMYVYIKVCMAIFKLTVPHDTVLIIMYWRWFNCVFFLL